MPARIHQLQFIYNSVAKKIITGIVIIIRQFTLHKIAVTMSCGSIWMMGNTLKKFNLKKSEIVNNAILVHYSIYTGSWTAE